jgi:BirA family biotin operon repressor/biotin-[acetyl-CoA-carboxylase] ligase
VSDAGDGMDSLDAAAIVAARGDWCPHAPAEAHESLASTNDRALALANEGAPEGTIVVAREQGAGRGRRGHSWTSPPGGLYVSLVLRPEEAMLRRLPATLLGGLAVAQALEGFDVQAELKWPNDVLVDGRKVAGILGEMSRGEDSGYRLVLGVGINVTTPASALGGDLQGLATSVLAETGRTLSLSDVLSAFLGHFSSHYRAIQRGGGAVILAMASARMPLLGQPIRVRMTPEKVLTGIASGLSATGGLVLEHEDGQRREVLLAGEVEGVASR